MKIHFQLIDVEEKENGKGEMGYCPRYFVFDFRKEKSQFFNGL